MSKYSVHTNAASHFAQADNRILGAYGTSFWRSWVYPFYTPSGYTVVENSPSDHPFHNGIWVGQNPVRNGDREGNFWAFPVKRSHDDHIMKKFGRMDPQGEPTIRHVMETACRPARGAVCGHAPVWSRLGVARCRRHRLGRRSGDDLARFPSRILSAVPRTDRPRPGRGDGTLLTIDVGAGGALHIPVTLEPGQYLTTRREYPRHCLYGKDHTGLREICVRELPPMPPRPFSLGLRSGSGQPQAMPILNLRIQRPRAERSSP